MAIATMATLPCEGRKPNNYYVNSLTGNDQANGLSPSTAWRSLQRANKAKLAPGDSLLLCRDMAYKGLLQLSAHGTATRRVVVSAYGKGRKPRIEAPDGAMYAVEVRNSDFMTVENLDVTNHGTQRMAGRTGVKVVAEEYGVAHDIRLNALYIHDVNGSLVKKQGGGSAILIVNRGRDKISTFDGLTIEDCLVRRCERNAMIWDAYWARDNWHPNRHVVVRRNVIEEVPGDGIVPIGCDSALIEYNLMRLCPGTLPHSEAAAGMWPWSCDNTVMRCNEVSGHKAPWDAQGFDSDYNCTNTRVTYNYSHDNDGGMLLICCDGNDRGAGNKGTVVEGNVSINDAIRPRATRNGVFSANIHIAGPCRGTLIKHNIIHVCPKTESFIDRSVVTSDTWDGYADSTAFRENIFYAPEPTDIRLTQSTRNSFEGNFFLGFFNNMPNDTKARRASDVYSSLVAKDPTGTRSLDFLFDNVVVGDGTAIMKVVNKNSVDSLFRAMNNER